MYKKFLMTLKNCAKNDLDPDPEPEPELKLFQSRNRNEQFRIHNNRGK
jgi:hypothetical protein